MKALLKGGPADGKIIDVSTKPGYIEWQFYPTENEPLVVGYDSEPVKDIVVEIHYYKYFDNDGYNLTYQHVEHDK